MRPTPIVPSHRLGLFTAVEAYTAGWTGNALHRAVARGELIRWRRGVYSVAWSAAAETSLHRRADVDLARVSIAAALTTPAVVASHLAVAALRRWPVWAPAPQACVHVDDDRTHVRGLHVHRTPVGSDVVQGPGFRHTGAATTVVDIACEFGTEAGLVVADVALERGHTTLARLERAVAAAGRRSGIEAARGVVRWADPRAESPLESRARWRCHCSGLPAPEPQAVIRDLDGVLLGRVDLYWDVGVVAEADGTDKMRQPGAEQAFLQRHAKLSRAGLRLVRFGWNDLEPFDATAAWIREELAAAAADTRPRRWVATST